MCALALEKKDGFLNTSFLVNNRVAASREEAGNYRGTRVPELCEVPCPEREDASTPIQSRA
jgi:hypothetical protein